MDTDQTTEHLKQIIETQSVLVLAGFDLQAFMDKVVERMLLLTPATGSVVELAEGAEIVYKATSGSVAPFVGVRLAMGNSLTGLCLRDREIKISSDTAKDPRVDFAACQRVGAASMVLVPLITNGEAVGALKVLSNKPNAFNEDNVATLQLMAGLLSGALAQQMEMEQRKKLEGELTQRTQELEHRNQQLISLLAELEKTSEELKLQNLNVLDATRFKSEFLANMSHEIRTPLKAIIGFTDILLRRDRNEQNRSFLENIRDAGRGLLTLINDILDFSKIEAGKMTIEMIDFDVENAVSGAAQLMLQQCQSKGLRLIKSVDANVPQRVIGDPERLRQLLINLLGNAVKFSSKGSIVLEVCCASHNPDGSVVLRFSVADEGVGLTSEESAKLFQPFVQADGSTTRKFGGTGLGLSICKHLVELMGGEIGIESVMGEGAKFWFTLPYAPAKSAETPHGLSPTVPARRGSFKPALILVADDHPVNQMVAQLQLEELGPSAHVVSNGREAIDALKTHTYAAVLMDCQMPEMDGLEATRQIRQLEAGAPGLRVPIIAMTANAMQGDKDPCIAAGMDDYVSKPVELKQLRRVLGRWLPLDESLMASELPPSTENGSNPDVWESSVVDVASLVVMFGDEIVRELLTKLIETTDEALQSFQTGLENRDREMMFAISHKLIGSCGTLKAQELHLLSIKLNEQARTADWDVLKEICNEITDAYARVKARVFNLLRWHAQ